MVPAVVLGDLNMLRCFAQTGVPPLVASSDAREPTLRFFRLRLPPKVYDVFAWDDPLPLVFGTLNYCTALGKRLFGAAR